MSKLLADPKEESLGTRQRFEIDFLTPSCFVLSERDSKLLFISLSLGTNKFLEDEF